MNAFKRSVSFALTFTLVSGALLANPVYTSAAAAKTAGTAKTQEPEKRHVPTTDAANVAPGEAAPIHLYDYRHPETQELIRFMYQPTPKAELMKFSPKKARMIVRGLGPERGIVPSVKKLFVDFPIEYVAFTAAMGLSQGLHTENNPVFAKNFISENASLAGGVSFLGFLAGSRGSHAFLQTLGLAHDPRLNPVLRLEPSLFVSRQTSIEFDSQGRPWTKTVQESRPNYFDTKPVLGPRPPTKVQRMFAPLVGPIGLAVGMTASNVIHEILADENLRTCAKAGLSSKPIAKDEASQRLLEDKIDEACEKAWEDWTLSKKAADYTPDILAMLPVALFLQPYVVNPLIKKTAQGLGRAATAGVARAGITLGTDVATGGVIATGVRAGAEKFVPVVLRGARVFAALSGAHPAGRLIITIGNIFIFMELIHPITPLIKKPFEQSRQGRDLTARTNQVFSEINQVEKNNWTFFRQRPETCDRYAEDPTGMAMAPKECRQAPRKDPAFLLKKLAERQAKWREFVLQDAYLEHSNWQKYVANYTTMYGNATAFYQQILSLINYQRNHERAKTMSATLYVAQPLNGLYVNADNRGSSSELGAAVTQARAWLETYLEGIRLQQRKSGFNWHPTERVFLPEILHGLRAYDKSIPLSALGAPEVAVSESKPMTEVQQRDFDRRIRSRYLANAVRKLREVLNGDRSYSDRGIQFGSEQYARLAEKNPFMALRMRLGNPEPLGVGIDYIRRANDDATVIEQTSKDNHPSAIGRISTPTMVDYLLVSMVCGPDVDKRYSDKEKIKIYTERTMGYYEQLLYNLGLGRRKISPEEGGMLVAVALKKEDDAKATRSLLPNPQTSTTSNEWIGFSADFRPPRIVEGVPASVCTDFADNSKKNLPSDDPHTSVWTIDGVRYEGILDIIRKKARVDLVGMFPQPNDKEVPFEYPIVEWWEKFVDQSTEEMVMRFRSSFKKILEKKYVPALTKSGPDESVEYNGRSFKLGALESLYDEADTYLSVMKKLGAVGAPPQQLKLIDDISAKIKFEYRNLGKLVANVDYVETRGDVAKEEFDLKRGALKTQIDELAKVVEESQKKAAATPDAIKIREQTVKNLNALMGELDSYWGIIRSIQVSPSI